MRTPLSPIICALVVMLQMPSAMAADDAQKPQQNPIVEDDDLPATLGSEFVTNAASRKLVQLTEKMKSSKRDALHAELHDVERVVKLDPQRTRLLKIAAEGALEQSVGNVRGNIQKSLDDRMKNANPRNVKKLLDGFESNYSINSPRSQGIWQGALQQVLKPEEKARWDEVVKQRAEYRAAALAAILEMELEQRVGAGEAQLEKFRPLLLKAVNDYLPDIQNMYSSDEERSIYSEYLPVLLMGVEEKAAKEIITDADQWKKWQDAPGQYRSNWEWIKRNHDSRMAQQKKGL